MFKQHLKVFGIVLFILIVTAAFYFVSQDTVNAIRP